MPRVSGHTLPNRCDMTTSASMEHGIDDGQPAVFIRLIGWLTLALMAAFFVNNILELGFEVNRGADGFVAYSLGSYM